jgi:hypothetical protein
MGSTSQLSHIGLEPAPGPHETPAEAVYGFVAPLDSKGMIDLEAWKHDRARYFVHRIEQGGAVRHGLLVHRPGGPSGATWMFDYELGAGDEETGYRFETHAFTPGAYVTVRDADEQSRTYRVAFVKPA